MPDQSPAVALRVAAQKLRETAAQASPGPWLIEYDYAGITPQAVYRMDPAEPDNVDESIDVGGMEAAADNVWAALMSPAVAESLVAWLEGVAGEGHEPDGGAQTMTHDCCTECHDDNGGPISWPCTPVSYTLVFARTILASTP